MKKSEKLDFETIKPILEVNDVQFAGVFGSYARGEEKPDSDVDILVKFKESKSFFEFFDVEEKIAKILKKKIDLVTEGALSPHIKPYIMNDLKIFYGQR